DKAFVYELKAILKKQIINIKNIRIKK
ncbi:hemerythrin, partial [Brachyspira pilosicoli]|nr:hemerythrin [Brachyspira pilosicoli]